MEAFSEHPKAASPALERARSIRRSAVIDVGTNSVKLLVADVEGARVEPVWEQSEQTRLGNGFYESHLLQPESIQQTARAVGTFAEKARGLNATALRVIATSAARDATNRDDLLNALNTASGVPTEIITGDQEAKWSYQGVTSDPSLAGQPLLIVDLGGGSTEFTLGDSDGVKFCESFPLGTVRCLEKTPLSDPPASGQLAATQDSVRRILAEAVVPRLEQTIKSMPRQPTRLIGTGGTASILARMELGTATFERSKIESTRFSQQRLGEWLANLWRLSLAERKKIAGLPSNRADVILFGVCIYDAILKTTGFSELAVSTRGVRFGAVLDWP